MTAPLIVCVVGVPGVGKSRLCTELAANCRARGLIVDHFQERDVLVRNAFSAVAREFSDGAGQVAPTTLVQATRRYVDHLIGDGVQVAVTDALIPFIPSLLAWGHHESELAQIIGELQDVTAAARVVVVHLVGDPERTLPRAQAREGAEWTRSYIDKLRAAPGTSHVIDLPSAAAHLRRETEVTRRVLAEARWTVIEIDADADADADAGNLVIPQVLARIAAMG